MMKPSLTLVLLMGYAAVLLSLCAYEAKGEESRWLPYLLSVAGLIAVAGCIAEALAWSGAQ